MKEVEQYFSDKVVSKGLLTGGSINQVWLIQLKSRGPMVVKTKTPAPQDFFVQEAKGLRELKKYREKGGPRVPEVYWVSSHLLCQEYLPPRPLDERELAIQLAKLHRQKASYFGGEQNNYLGETLQPNRKVSHWGDFFVNDRLSYQLEINQLDQISTHFQSIKNNLMAFLDEHNPYPAPCHGDLWNGNVCGSPHGPCLIDPAFYFADREVDLAMTEMFGGFSSLFYQAYHEEYPLPSGYESRKVIYNWYHFLNHLHLFGTSYLPSVEHSWRFIQSLF